MKKTILLLTKSSKRSPRTEALDETGYCVAGIDVETGEWIRLVAPGDCNDESLIGNDLIDEFGNTAVALDLVRVSVQNPVPIGCQTENWLMDVDEYIDILGHASLSGIFSLHPAELPDYAYVDTSEYLVDDEIDDIKKSLIIVPAENVYVHNVGQGHFRRTKVSFTFNENEYHDLSMTDPEYYSHVGETFDYAFLVISLPHESYDNGRYYKFVAKIIEATEDEYNAFFPEKPELEIDYDEQMTIGEAYDRYGNVVSPLVVVADNWNNDYCFSITNVIGDKAYGDTFRRGEHFEFRSFPLSKLVRIYNGPSIDFIREYMSSSDEEASVFIDVFEEKYGKIIDFYEVDYIENLFNKYSPLIDRPIIVKRQGWNMYYLVVKDIIDGTVCGDLYWNDGNFYKETNLVDLQKFQMYESAYMRFCEDE